MINDLFIFIALVLDCSSQYSGDLKRTSTTTDNAVPNWTQTTAKYRGYYDDPSMRMDVSPVVFVGAVVGGIALLVVVAFAVFFRYDIYTSFC